MQIALISFTKKTYDYFYNHLNEEINTSKAEKFWELNFIKNPNN